MIAAETLVELEDLVCPGCGGAVLAEPPRDALSQEFSHNDGSCVWRQRLLAANSSAHTTMINGSALCAALAVTERD
jgi:hypothetical protein